MIGDANATRKTKSLYTNLQFLSANGIMFGHQDDLSYGAKWWAVPNRSDVLETTGSYPAVFGWDLGGLHTDRNLDSVAFTDIKKGIIKAYKMGGINTISWHIFHPLDTSSSWDKKAEVKDILPGGQAHEAYLKQLDQLASFFNSCKAGFFNKIPIVFRPFHEHNGNWFWWGKGNCTEQENIELWQFTVDYLKITKKLHQLIYAYSPDRSRINLDSGFVDYLYGYPGDDYVDIIGLDNYWDTGHGHNRATMRQQREDLKKSVILIDSIAIVKNKIAALTETGNNGQTIENWYTNTLLNPLLEITPTPQIAWVLVWRNGSTENFFVPYKGQKNEGDFLSFYKLPATLFLKNIKNPYSRRFNKILKEETL